ncbi:MAG TPA: LemA family protein [Acidobacteriaceae bacterium]|nr:LemA family protein [Acidobacteriaceae bacterium]
MERRRYNQSLQDYNSYIRHFPNNIWASIGGFQQNNAYFEASPGSQNAPTVKF